MGTSRPGQMGSGNLYQTRKNSKWNTTFWARLKEFENNYHNGVNSVESLVDDFADMADGLRYDLPYRYGGLQQSFTVDKEDTPSGKTVRLYLKNEPHKNLQPDNEHEDNFTNPTLASWLTRKRKSKPKMVRFRRDMRDQIKTYELYLRSAWKEEFK